MDASVFSRRASLIAVAAASVIAAVTVAENRQNHPVIGTLTEGVDGVDGLGEIRSMAFADNRVYLSSERDHCLTVLSEQKEDGKLKLDEYLARDRSGSVPAGARKLPVEQVSGIGGGTVCSTKDGEFVFHAADANILVFQRGEDQRLNIASFCGEPGTVAVPRAGYLRLVATADEKFLFATRVRDKSLEAFRFDRRGKRLTPIQVLPDIGHSAAIAVSPDGRHLYVGSWTPRKLSAFAIDAESGQLTAIGELTGRDCGLRLGLLIGGLEVSPDGTQVVLTSVMNEGEVAILNRDAASGRLTSCQVISKAKSDIGDLDNPVCTAFARDGKTLYVGCDESRCVVVLRKDDASRSFSYLETIKHPNMGALTCVAEHDGFLFVCSGDPGTLTVFRINEREPKSKTDDANENRP